MAFFGLFGTKTKGYASPWLHLTVVHASVREGLEPDDAFALRGMVIGAHPIDFEFRNPGGFTVYFPGSADGLAAANGLASELRTYSRDNSLSAFGVGVGQGECLAQRSASGKFVARPVGTVISVTMNAAIQEADSSGGR